MGEKGLGHREKGEFLVEMELNCCQQLAGDAVEAKATKEQGKPYRQAGPAQVFDDDSETLGGGGVQGWWPGLSGIVGSRTGASVDFFLQTPEKDLHEFMSFGGQAFAFRGQHFVFYLAKFYQKFSISRVLGGIG